MYGKIPEARKYVPPVYRRLSSYELFLSIGMTGVFIPILTAFLVYASTHFFPILGPIAMFIAYIISLQGLITTIISTLIYTLRSRPLITKLLYVTLLAEAIGVHVGLYYFMATSTEIISREAATLINLAYLLGWELFSTAFALSSYVFYRESS